MSLNFGLWLWSGGRLRQRIIVRRAAILVAVLLISMIGLVVQSPPPESTIPVSPHETLEAPVGEAYGKLPLSFEANMGQSDAQVKFLGHGQGYMLFLTSSGAVLSLRLA